MSLEQAAEAQLTGLLVNALLNGVAVAVHQTEVNSLRLQRLALIVHLSQFEDGTGDVGLRVSAEHSRARPLGAMVEVLQQERAHPALLAQGDKVTVATGRSLDRRPHLTHLQLDVIRVVIVREGHLGIVDVGGLILGVVVLLHLGGINLLLLPGRGRTLTRGRLPDRHGVGIGPIVGVEVGLRSGVKTALLREAAAAQEEFPRDLTSRLARTSHVVQDHVGHGVGVLLNGLDEEVAEAVVHVTIIEELREIADRGLILQTPLLAAHVLRLISQDLLVAGRIRTVGGVIEVVIVRPEALVVFLVRINDTGGSGIVRTPGRLLIVIDRIQICRVNLVADNSRAAVGVEALGLLLRIIRGDELQDVVLTPTLAEIHIHNHLGVVGRVLDRKEDLGVVGLAVHVDLGGELQSEVVPLLDVRGQDPEHLEARTIFKVVRTVVDLFRTVKAVVIEVVQIQIDNAVEGIQVAGGSARRILGEERLERQQRHGQDQYQSEAQAAQTIFSHRMLHRSLPFQLISKCITRL